MLSNRTLKIIGLILIFLTIAAFAFVWWANPETPPTSHTAALNPTQKPVSTPMPTPVVHTVNLMAVGDIMMHSPQITAGKTANGYDFNSFFSFIAPTLERGDVVIGNLETPLGGPETGYTGYPMFNAPDEYADALKAAHFDVLSTANNHSLDRREAGLLRTIQQLDQRGITHMGTYATAAERDKPVVIEKNNISFGLLAYSYGTNGMPIPDGKPYLINLIDKQLMKKDIETAKAAGVDVVVVAIHFGNEYQRKPSAFQKENVDFLFEAGADIILGSHPHVVQPYQVREIQNADGTKRKGVVIYSLGNFISNQRDNPTDIGGVLSINIEKRDEQVEMKDATFIPTYVHRYVSGGKRVYNVLPMEDTIKQRNYAPFTERDYATLQTRLEEMQAHAVSAP